MTPVRPPWAPVETVTIWNVSPSYDAFCDAQRPTFGGEVSGPPDFLQDLLDRLAADNARPGAVTMRFATDERGRILGPEIRNPLRSERR